MALDGLERFTLGVGLTLLLVAVGVYRKYGYPVLALEGAE